jgi:hypothetical protein
MPDAQNDNAGDPVQGVVESGTVSRRNESTNLPGESQDKEPVAKLSRPVNL